MTYQRAWTIGWFLGRWEWLAAINRGVVETVYVLEKAWQFDSEADAKRMIDVVNRVFTGITPEVVEIEIRNVVVKRWRAVKDENDERKTK